MTGCICPDRYGNPHWPVTSPPAQHVHGCPVRDRWLAEAVTPEQVVDVVHELLRRFSPSAIPDLRGRASAQREKMRERWSDLHRPWAVYPFDEACDLIEDVMMAVGITGPTAGGSWAIYDELRDYGR